MTSGYYYCYYSKHFSKILHFNLQSFKFFLMILNIGHPVDLRSSGICTIHLIINFHSDLQRSYQCLRTESVSCWKLNYNQFLNFHFVRRNYSTSFKDYYPTWYLMWHTGNCWLDQLMQQLFKKKVLMDCLIVDCFQYWGYFQIYYHRYLQEPWVSNF